MVIILGNIYIYSGSPLVGEHRKLPEKSGKIFFSAVETIILKSCVYVNTSEIGFRIFFINCRKPTAVLQREFTFRSKDYYPKKGGNPNKG